MLVCGSQLVLVSWILFFDWFFRCISYRKFPVVAFVFILNDSVQWSFHPVITTSIPNRILRTWFAYMHISYARAECKAVVAVLYTTFLIDAPSLSVFYVTNASHRGCATHANPRPFPWIPFNIKDTICSIKTPISIGFYMCSRIRGAVQ